MCSSLAPPAWLVVRAHGGLEMLLGELAVEVAQLPLDDLVGKLSG